MEQSVVDHLISKSEESLDSLNRLFKNMNRRICDLESEVSKLKEKLGEDEIIFPTCDRFVESEHDQIVEITPTHDKFNFKLQLQSYYEKRSLPKPIYTYTEDKFNTNLRFRCDILKGSFTSEDPEGYFNLDPLDDDYQLHVIGTSSGPSKKIASRNAARDALRQLE